MFGIGIVEMLLIGVALPLIGLFVLYAVIRVAVRDGFVDAERRIDAERVRGSLGIGQERSPNTRR